MRRLLLLGCSDTKRPDPAPLPALERYDGPFFRVLRAHVRRGGAAPAVLILSAKYGVVAGDAPLPWYDVRMDAAAARRWSADAACRSRLVGAVDAATDVFAAAGEDYLRVFDALLGARRYQAPPKGAGIGTRLGLLKQWLGAPR